MKLLLDTDIVVDYLRGVPEAIAYLEARSETLVLSAITVAELYAGVREGKERTALHALLGAFMVVPVDQGIAERGGLLRREYGKSHGWASRTRSSPLLRSIQAPIWLP
jgi:predicted nucleic acid-binding protein